MPHSFEASPDAPALRLAVALAVAAAIFMIAIWAPIQIRAFDDALANDHPLTTTSRINTSYDADWERFQLVTSGGELTNVAASNGRVRIVTMLYGHCPGACPLAIATLRNIEGRLSPRQRDQLGVVGITLDPANDTPESLNEFAKSVATLGSHWILGVPSRDAVAGFAKALGVRYHVAEDGAVDHQSVFVLLGKHGEILARTVRTRQIDNAFVAALASALD